jgi:hypothetical protein
MVNGTGTGNGNGNGPWSAIQSMKDAELPLFEWSQVDFMTGSMDGFNGDGWIQSYGRRRRKESYMLEYRPTYRQLRYVDPFMYGKTDHATIRLLDSIRSGLYL